MSAVSGFLVFAIISSFAFATAESPQSFTYQGQLTNAAGTAPLVDIVAMTIGIYSKNDDCLLYEETQTVDLTQTAGLFTIQVGTGTRSANDPGKIFAQVFANTGTVLRAAGSPECANGYTPAAGDPRYIRFMVTPQSTGVPNVLSPDQILTSVPQAIVAETLQGKGPTSFLQVEPNTNLSQSSLEVLTGSAGAVVDASSLHNHDSLYVKLGSAAGSQSLGPIVVNDTAGSTGVTVTGASGQTSDLLDVNSSGGNKYFSIDKTGNVNLGASETFGLGSFTIDPVGLAASDAGKMWYEGGVIKYWNGTAVETLGVSGTNYLPLTGGALTGNVGIGTSSPTAPLQFSAGVGRKISLYGGDPANDYQYHGLGVATNELVVNIPDSSHFIGFNAGTSSTSSTELVRITGTGNVGIGTTSPASPLTVAATPTATPAAGLVSIGEGGFAGASGNFAGSANGTEIAVNSGSGFTGNLIDLQKNGVSQFSVSSAGVITGNGSGLTNLPVSSVNWTAPGTIGSATPNTGAFTTLSATGNSTFASSVGIGTTSPLKLLTIDQNASGGAPDLNTAQLDIRGYHGGGSDYAGLRFRMAEHTTGWGSDIQGYDDTGFYGGALLFRTGAGSATNTPTERMRITSAGNVGIGTATPIGSLSVASPDIGAQFGLTAWSNAYSVFGPNAGSANGAALGMGYSTTSDAANILSVEPGVTWKPLNFDASSYSFYSNGGALGLTQNASGQVGIGTNNPSTALQVNGTVTATAFVGDGSQLTSIGSGAVNWAQPGTIGSTTPSTGAFTTLTTSGNVGIGTTNAPQPLTVSGNIQSILESNNTTQNVATLTAIGYSGVTGAANWSLRGVYQYGSGVNGNAVGGDLDLIKSQDGNTILATKTDGTSLGNVGIGTTSPTSSLYVQSALNWPNNAFTLSGSGTNDTGFLLTNTSTGGHQWLTQSTGQVNSLGAGKYVIWDITSGTDPRFVIDTAGQVGIGTTSPSTELQVNGTVTATAFAGDGSQLTNLPVSSVNWTAPGTIGSATPNTGAFTTLTASGNIQSVASSTNQIILSSAGNGADNYPHLQLFNTGGYGEGFIDFYTYGGQGLGTPTSRWRAQDLGNFTGGQFFSASTPNANGASTDVMFVGNTGGTGLVHGNFGVGILTNTPVSALDVNGGVSVGSYAATHTAPSNGLIVSGAVGIGTNNPSTALQVNGTVTATAFAGDGSQLTSIGSGAVNWAQPGAIGATTPNTGAFTGLSTTGALAVGTTGQFNVNSAGNPTSINGVTTNFPSAQGAAGTTLQNDGAGNLSWQSTLPIDYISGLVPTWVSASSVSIGSGTAMVNGTLVTNTSSVTVNFSGLSASTWYYLYLTPSGSVTYSTTVPTVYQGTASQATISGTVSRFIGSVLTDGSSNVYSFYKDGEKVLWMSNSPFASPNLSATSYTSVTLPGVPATCRVAWVQIRPTSIGNTIVVHPANLSTNNAFILIGNGVYASYGGPLLLDQNQQYGYISDGGNLAMNTYTLGYSEIR